MDDSLPYTNGEISHFGFFRVVTRGIVNGSKEDIDRSMGGDEEEEEEDDDSDERLVSCDDSDGMG